MTRAGRRRSAAIIATTLLLGAGASVANPASARPRGCELDTTGDTCAVSGGGDGISCPIMAGLFPPEGDTAWWDCPPYDTDGGRPHRR